MILFVVGISFVKHLDSNFINNPFITWSPPSFYSNDIQQGSIPTYHVYVQNQDGSVIVNDNTTDTFYQLPSNITEYCDIYTATVTAFIKQYTSIGINSTKEYSGSKLI